MPKLPNSFIDESAMRIEGEPIEWERIQMDRLAENGLTVQEIEMDEFLAEREAAEAKRRRESGIIQETV